MFNLDYQERFVGAMLGGVVLAGCIAVLALFPIPKVSDINELIERHFPNLARLFLVTIFVNVLMKLYLFSIDFGSAYTEGAITARDTRNPFQLFMINGELYTSFVIATIALAIWLMKPESIRVKPGFRALALLMVIVMPVYTIVLLKGRLVALLYMFIYLFALQIRSQKWTLAGFQWLYCLGPILAVGTVYVATLALGRDFRDIGAEPSMSLNAGLVGWRTDLTDLGAAMLKQTEGKSNDPTVVNQGVLNAVPTTFWGKKDEALRDNYHEALASLGWPAGLNGQPDVDYADNLFSMGAMAFGQAGFFLLFPIYIAFITGLAVWLCKYKKHFIVLMPLLFLNVIFIRTEFEWQSMFLYFRDLILYTTLFIALGSLAMKLRLGSVVIRTRSPEAA
jgi:hypothetical protein